MFHYISLIIPVAVLLPNLLFFGMPPRNTPTNVHRKSNPIFTIAESIGRFGVCVLPIFSVIQIDKPNEIFSLMGMIAFLLLYYSGWVRYFIRNRDYPLLFSPLIGIPVPLTIAPILYFLCASVVLHSFLFFLSSLILAAGHIPTSLHTYHQIHHDNK
ncbi:hypothetical protein E0485_05380 [Paenibacillus albiflavus]|uniref:Uncharacterized protein n=1 Tax=Paenibacillus albiflavus TaxID=2545760 RepID=A0A4R4ELU9_9BACL|nr:hypothetical protein [Paenibacillus albiflavus]TCZ79298.1 hypothetical protein E0485_05380 [Paenibacillus albiflavus]